MANLITKILDSLKFSDEDEEESYNEYLKAFNEKKNKREEKDSSVKKPVETRSAVVSAPSQKEETKPRVVPDRGKVIPMKTNIAKDFELKVIRPTGFSDCQAICDILLDGDAVIVNIENVDEELSQRIMDFVSGTVYAIDGALTTVSKVIYIVSPPNVTISGDVLNLLSSDGVEAPTIAGKF